MNPIRTFHVALFVSLILCGQPLFADDWPQWLGPRRDSGLRESGIVEKFSSNGPRE